MEPIRFVDIFGNEINRFQIQHSFEKKPSRSIVEQYIEELRKLYPKLMIHDDVNKNDVLTFLIMSLVNVTSEENRLSRFTFALYFFDLILSQNRPRCVSIESIGFENDSELTLYFCDSINETVFKENKIDGTSTTSFSIDARLIREYHLIANSIMGNLNYCDTELALKTVEGVKKISFRKTFWDCYDGIDYQVEIEFSYLAAENEKGKVVFINDQHPFIDCFINYSQNSTIYPTDFDSFNAFLTFYTLSDKNSKPLRRNSGPIMKFEFNFLKNVIYLVHDPDPTDLSFKKEWTYIFNGWINHLIFPGFQERYYFQFLDRKKPKCKIIRDRRCERSFNMKRSMFSFQMWFVLKPSFSECFRSKMIEFNTFLNQDLINVFCTRYQRKQPYCLPHPRKNPEKYYTNTLFYSYKGVYFIDHWMTLDETQYMPGFMIQWAGLENRFTECHRCDHNDPFEEIDLTNSTLTTPFLNEILLFSYFGIIPSKENPYSSSRALQPSSSNIVRSPDPIDVNFTFFIDIPTKGGTIAGAMIDFPKLNISFDQRYQLKFELKYISPSNTTVEFAIWYYDKTNGLNIIMFHQKLEESFCFCFGKMDISDKVFYYGEIDIIWGKCEFNDSPVIFENIEFTPECVINYNIQRKIELESKKFKNQFLFGIGPQQSIKSGKDSKRMSEADLLDDGTENWSFFFILQNGLDLPADTIRDQDERHLLFLNTSLPGKRKNYVLKCRWMSQFQMGALFQYNDLDYLITQNIFTLSKHNRYYFNFFMHPKMDHLHLPQTIPIQIIMILVSKGTAKRQYLGIKPSNASVNGDVFIMGSAYDSVTFLTQTLIGGEKEFLTIVFN